jgi:hypothetical protein
LQDADALSDLVGADPASCTYAVKALQVLCAGSSRP